MQGEGEDDLYGGYGTGAAAAIRSAVGVGSAVPPSTGLRGLKSSYALRRPSARELMS